MRSLDAPDISAHISALGTSISAFYQRQQAKHWPDKPWPNSTVHVLSYYHPHFRSTLFFWNSINVPAWLSLFTVLHILLSSWSPQDLFTLLPLLLFQLLTDLAWDWPSTKLFILPGGDALLNSLASRCDLEDQYSIHWGYIYEPLVPIWLFWGAVEPLRHWP